MNPNHFVKVAPCCGSACHKKQQETDIKWEEGVRQTAVVTICKLVALTLKVLIPYCKVSGDTYCSELYRKPITNGRTWVKRGGRGETEVCGSANWTQYLHLL